MVDMPGLGQQQQQQQLHGASLTKRQFVCLALTLSLGTISQWYDYTVYMQLSSTLAGVFFPASHWMTAHLSFYGVYAAGFLARPLGAVLFGHLGDAFSRRGSVVASMWVTLLATVGIGCLPTYNHVGTAAPIMLAVLRFLQGMSVGGEYGAAVVYLFEAAPVGRKGLCASLAAQAVAPGVILGILACLGVLHFCAPSQLLLWGWRVPFLAAVFAAPPAVLLRTMMKEPREFITSKRQHLLQRVAAKAAAHIAATFSTQRTTTGRLMTKRQIHRHLRTITKVVLSPRASISDNTSYSSQDDEAMQLPPRMRGFPTPVRCAAAMCTNACQRGGSLLGGRASLFGEAADIAAAPAELLASARPSDAGSDDVDGHPADNACQLSHTKSAAAAAAAAARGAMPEQQPELKLWLDEDSVVADIGCELQYVAQLEHAGSRMRRHVPLAVVAAQHKQLLWLQFFLESSYAATFYIFTGWLPSYLRATTSLGPQSIMWALLAGMLAYAAAAPYGGFLVDRGIPKLWTLMGLSLGVCAVSIPVMFAVHRGALVYLMVLLPCMLAVAGCMGGVISSIGPQMYPSAVRVTGFTLGHSLATSVWGGLSPFMISAILLLIEPSTLAAGVLLVVMGLVSWAAALALINVMPHINARGVRTAPQMQPVRPQKYVAALKGMRRRKETVDGAAAAAAAENATAAVAAAGHGTVQHSAFEAK